MEVNDDARIFKMCLVQYFIFERVTFGINQDWEQHRKTFRSRRCPTHACQNKTTGVHSWLGKERGRVVAMDALETK